MATSPFDVMRELAVMQERMNRIWGSSFDRGHEDVTSRGNWMPPVDIYETPERQIVLKAELPGLRREDIDLTVENSTLTIRGERRRDEGVAEDRYHRVERAYGAFTRSFTLPNTIDGAKVRADYRDGVLTVTLPTREEARPRQIQVNVAE
ncbi:MAG TPA: Hsp20/alpha crystallin family protein [Vicinamibacterales bacterium]